MSPSIICVIEIIFDGCTYVYILKYATDGRRFSNTKRVCFFRTRGILNRGKLNGNGLNAYIYAEQYVFLTAHGNERQMVVFRSRRYCVCISSRRLDRSVDKVVFMLLFVKPNFSGHSLTAFISEHEDDNDNTNDVVIILNWNTLYRASRPNPPTSLFCKRRDNVLKCVVAR